MRAHPFIMLVFVLVSETTFARDLVSDPNRIALIEWVLSKSTDLSKQPVVDYKMLHRYPMTPANIILAEGPEHYFETLDEMDNFRESTDADRKAGRKLSEVLWGVHRVTVKNKKDEAAIARLRIRRAQEIITSWRTDLTFDEVLNDLDRSNERARLVKELALWPSVVLQAHSKAKGLEMQWKSGQWVAQYPPGFVELKSGFLTRSAPNAATFFMKVRRQHPDSVWVPLANGNWKLASGKTRLSTLASSDGDSVEIFDQNFPDKRLLGSVTKSERAPKQTVLQFIKSRRESSEACAIFLNTLALR